MMPAKKYLTILIIFLVSLAWVTDISAVNQGNGVGNTGPGNQGHGPNPTAGNAGGGNGGAPSPPPSTGGGSTSQPPPSTSGGSTSTSPSGGAVSTTKPGAVTNTPNNAGQTTSEVGSLIEGNLLSLPPATEESTKAKEKKRAMKNIAPSDQSLEKAVNTKKIPKATTVKKKGKEIILESKPSTEPQSTTTTTPSETAASSETTITTTHDATESSPSNTPQNITTPPLPISNDTTISMDSVNSVTPTLSNIVQISSTTNYVLINDDTIVVNSVIDNNSHPNDILVFDMRKPSKNCLKPLLVNTNYLLNSKNADAFICPIKNRAVKFINE